METPFCEYLNTCRIHQCTKLHPCQIPCPQMHNPAHIVMYCQYYHPQNYIQPQYMTQQWQYNHNRGKNRECGWKKSHHQHHKKQGWFRQTHFRKHHNYQQQVRQHPQFFQQLQKQHIQYRQQQILEQNLDKLTLKQQKNIIQSLVSEDELKMMNEKLIGQGLKNTEKNIAILRFLKGNIIQAQKVLLQVKQYISNLNIQNAQQKNYNENLCYIYKLGFDIYLKHQIINKVCQKQVSLIKIIQILKCKQHMKQKQQQYKQKISQRPYLWQYNPISQLPVNINTIYIIDGHNVTPSHKHLRKLYYGNKKQKAQGIVRLKLLINACKLQGFFVVDRNEVPQQEQIIIKQQTKVEKYISEIFVQHINDNKIKIVYANQGSTADQKIRQILLEMTLQQRSRCVIVSKDIELIQSCLDICQGIKGMRGIMKGNDFIKRLKKILPKDLRKMILKRTNAEIKRQFRF